MRAAPMRALYRLLRQLEALAGTGIACLRASDGHDLGRVMMMRGRICYAAAPGMRMPVGRILTDVDPLFERLVAVAVEQASAQGRRLCEVLLEHDVERLAMLREGLRRQIVLALGAVLEDDGAPSLADFVPARDDYDRRLTFAPFDVLLAMQRQRDTAPADRATRFFESCKPFADAALLLLQRASPDGLPMPLAAPGFEDLPLEHLVPLARAAEVACLAGGVPNPRLVAHMGARMAWIGVVGDTHLALVRSGQELLATHLLSLALRALGQDPG
jgi:hypothetical protein